MGESLNIRFNGELRCKIPEKGEGDEIGHKSRRSHLKYEEPSIASVFEQKRRFYK